MKLCSCVFPVPTERSGSPSFGHQHKPGRTYLRKPLAIPLPPAQSSVSQWENNANNLTHLHVPQPATIEFPSVVRLNHVAVTEQCFILLCSNREPYLSECWLPTCVLRANVYTFTRETTEPCFQVRIKSLPTCVPARFVHSILHIATG